MNVSATECTGRTGRIAARASQHGESKLKIAVI
jgi:hypothetical protein